MLPPPKLHVFLPYALKDYDANDTAVTNNAAVSFVVILRLFVLILSLF